MMTEKEFLKKEINDLLQERTEKEMQFIYYCLKSMAKHNIPTKK